ncbi:MAG: type II TA system antitoxin MqsA family protein [Bacilli bacterium]
MLPYCERCNDEVEFEETFNPKQQTIKGRELAYLAKEAHCAECGSLIFEPNVHDYNLKQVNDAYRKAEDIITIPEIKIVLDRYKIGKRPLSLVLGWGEGTLTRYLNGDIPTKQYSQTLRKLTADPKFLMELLEENKEKVSESTYLNCKQSIHNLLGESAANCATNQNKIDSAAQYLLYKSEEITPLALQKLLYFSQGFNRIVNDTFLFEDDCEAGIHGPVYRMVYERYRQYGYDPIEEKRLDYNFDLLSESEKELLDCVVNTFGCYSGKVLERITQIESPWRQAREGLGMNEDTDKIITKESIEGYFYDVKGKYRMVNVADMKDYSLDVFRKIRY